MAKQNQATNGGYVSYPPKIINNKPRFHKEIALKACCTLKLPKRERNLFLYYESCSTGFKPALSLVEKKTEIAANKISEIRKRLHDKCLICYDRDKKVLTIQWEVIASYACGLILNHQRFYSPAEYEYHFKKIRDCKPKYKYKNVCRELTKAETMFFNYLENLTAYQYDILLKAMPERNGLRFRRVQVIDTEADFEQERKLLFGSINEGIKEPIPYKSVFPEYDEALPF